MTEWLDVATNVIILHKTQWLKEHLQNAKQKGNEEWNNKWSLDILICPCLLKFEKG